jgi:hypothetical protein
MRKQSSVKQQPLPLPTRRQRGAPKEEDCVVVIAETEAGERRIMIPRSAIGMSVLVYLDSREGC